MALSPVLTDFMDKSKFYVKQAINILYKLPLYVSINRFLLKVTSLLKAVLTSKLD